MTREWKVTDDVAALLEKAAGLPGVCLAYRIAEDAEAKADAAACAADDAMQELAGLDRKLLPDELPLGLALHRAHVAAEARVQALADALDEFVDALKAGDVDAAREIENTFCEG
jgi:hypothetical protein